jgi:transcriptional regulator with XRE-family HTH domain
MNIAERIKESRKQKKWTQEDLATNSGVSRDTIAKLETGKIAQPKDIEALAKSLDQSPCWLLFGNEDHKLQQKLTETEDCLLNLYRQMSNADKIVAIRVLEALSSNAVNDK